MTAHAYDGDGHYLGLIPHDDAPVDDDSPIERGGPEYQVVELHGGPFNGELRIILTTGLTLWPATGWSA